MANTNTTNLNLIKPEVGADTDAWGGHYNSDFDALDAQLAGTIYGLTLSTAGSSATFGIASGGASGMALASAYTKTTSAWAVGTATGSLDTGTIANSTWYHVWLIQRTDTSVVDVLISTSATAPTMPTNYTRKRRIGAMKTNGSAQWTKFVQIDDEFLWDAVVGDASGVSIGTSSASVTLTVPTGVQVQAIVYIGGAAGTSGLNYLTAYSPDVTTHGAGLGASQASWTTGSTVGTGTDHIRTNTSAQIKVVAAQASSQYSIATAGWIDPRGKF